jgi:hypothetical protein
MFETTIDRVNQAETTNSGEALHELAEVQLVLVGGGAGIALCE